MTTRADLDPLSASSTADSRSVKPLKSRQFADPGFGNRLADARNLMHTQAPLNPDLTHHEHRTVVGSVASDVAKSIRQDALIPLGAPKHGWEKGSYRLPFDYHIVGHTVGGKNTCSVMTPFIPRVSLTPAHNYMAQETPVYGVEPNAESGPSCRKVTPGPDAQERYLSFGSLCMIRKTGVALRQDDREKLFTFIDSYMSESLHSVVERDGILPNVVCKDAVSIPMTDANWAKYNQLLAVFGFASGMHAMLAVGSDEFDNYTYVVDGMDAQHVEGWKVLASAGERNLDMMMLSRELMQVWKGMWVCGGAGYVGTLESFE